MFEIRFTHSMELLEGNLPRRRAEEELELYKQFFGEHSVVMVYENQEERRRRSWAQEYKNDYINYFGELQRMGNLL